MKVSLLLSSLWLAAQCMAAADSVSLTAARDTSIYSDNTSNADGGGVSFIVGTTGATGNPVRRGLLFFDFSSIPLGAVIQSVSLKLTLINAPAGDVNRAISLHASQVSWGENEASAPGSTMVVANTGVAAQTGDATWLSRFDNLGPAWSAPGGDFATAASATTNVSSTPGDWTWSDPAMVADVQSWVNNSASNNGWFLLGDETTSKTNRQFATREAASAVSRPMITVTYAVPEPSAGLALLAGSALVASRRRQP